MIVVKFCKNYADEFDVCGLRLFKDKNEFQNTFMKNARAYFEIIDSINSSDIRVQRIKKALDNNYVARTMLRMIDKNDSYEDVLQKEIKQCNEWKTHMACFSICFGTNQYLSWTNFKDFMSCFEVIDNVDPLVSVCFPGGNFGVFPNVSDETLKELNSALKEKDYDAIFNDTCLF